MKKLVYCLAVLSGLALGSAQAAEPHAAAPAAAMKPMAAKADMPTCGQMMASRAPIPAKLSEAAATVADMLEAHAALMGKDKESVNEAKMLKTLAKSHRQVSAGMLKTSEEMKKVGSTPAAPHDMAKMMSDPKLTEASKKMIEIQKELIALLQKSVAEDEAMMKGMK